MTTGTEARPEVRERSPSAAARWETWVARKHWWVLGVWIVLLGAAGAAYPYLESQLVAPDYSVTGSDSDRVSDLISRDFTAAGGEQDVVVLDSDTLRVTDPVYPRTTQAVLAAVRRSEGVVQVIGPSRSSSRSRSWCCCSRSGRWWPR